MVADHPTLASSGNVLWAIFDAEYYARHNPAAAGINDPNALLEHYLQHGAGASYSPNPWFDEAFYRARNPDVVALIQAGDVACGFDHYCRLGYVDRAPHWLFDPVFYEKSNPDLTKEVLEASDFVNSYDHYLKYGASEGRRAHPLFDPATYIAGLSAAARSCARAGAYTHFLMQDWSTDAEPPAANFDPAAYCAKYPEVIGQIRVGRWHSALHHFLVNSDFFSQATVVPPRASGPAPPIKINIDRPQLRDGAAINPIIGHLDIVGWAASNHCLTSVEIFVDHLLLGQAHHGIRTEGVAAAFPEFGHAQFAGLRFVATTQIPSGHHHVRIVARDVTGFEVAETFSAEFEPEADREGPWSLRRRMHETEAEFKLNLLQNAGVTPEFVIVLRKTDDAEAVARSYACLQRQVYARWYLPEAPPSGSDLWLIQLTPGDEPGADALLELALHLLRHRQADFIYSDERRVDPSTGTMVPFFKPDWSPELLLATNYIGRLWAVRAGTAQRAGLDPPALAEIGAYDAVLRLTEHATKICHVPKVLCESVPQPFADLPADKLVLQAAMRRRGLAARVEPGRLPHTWRLRPETPATPLISIIIPTAGTGNLITIALRSLRAITDYPHVEVIVVDTRPGRPAGWKASFAAADLVIEDDGGFNWSRLNNRAAAFAHGEVLLFLNDDVEITAPDWLRAFIEPLQHKEVGIVGPLLLYPSGAVQHAGMFLTREIGYHAFQGLHCAAPGPLGLALTQRNVSSVTGACMLIRRDLFDRLGGFDERFDLTFNDVDLCLRAVGAGARVVYTPHCSLIHHESASRAGLSEAANTALFAQCWSSRLDTGDPYFNPNLSLCHTDHRPEHEPIEIIYPAHPLARTDSIRRILVITLDHIGDFVLSLPGIRRLKQHFPAARLSLLAGTEICRFAAKENAIDEVIDSDQPAPVGAPLDPDRASFPATLQNQNFDLAIDLRPHAESRHILRATSATWLAGFDSGFAFPWLDIVGFIEPGRAKAAKRGHISDTVVDLANKIGAAFALTWSPPQAPSVRAWPAQLAFPPVDASFGIAIHPGSGAAIKRWPAAYFASLINMMSEVGQCWFVLVGGVEETALADDILSRVGPGIRIANMIGQTNLDDLAHVLRAMDLFIGNVSGPYHLAASLGVPTVGLHSGVVGAGEWAPLAPSAIAVRKRTVCSPCYLTDSRDCPRNLTCLTEMEPSHVLNIIKNERRLLY